MSSSSSPPTIAVIAPGSMGAAVGARLVSHGCTVLTTLEGRSEATRKRAADAGLEEASLTDIARRARWVLSILPPSDAEALAVQFRDAAGAETQAVFVDCNAVSPATAKRIAKVFAGTGVRFLDASIIGGPPKDEYNPAIYASADGADAALLEEFVGLEKWGLRIMPLKGEGSGIGDASALKMSYAGMTKGFSGICTLMVLAAHASSPATATALLHELHASQPAFLERMTKSIPSMLPKAYRWAGEMEEISSFVAEGVQASDERGTEAQVHAGLARLYERVDNALPGGEDVSVLKKFVEDAKQVIGGGKESR